MNLSDLLGYKHNAAFTKKEEHDRVYYKLINDVEVMPESDSELMHFIGMDWNLSELNFIINEFDYIDIPLHISPNKRYYIDLKRWKRESKINQILC